MGNSTTFRKGDGRASEIGKRPRPNAHKEVRDQQAARLARFKTGMSKLEPKAMTVLEELMQPEHPPQVRYNSAVKIIEYNWGKPESVSNPVMTALENLSSDDISGLTLKEATIHLNAQVVDGQ